VARPGRKKTVSLFYNGQDVVFTHHKVIVAINLDICAGIFTEQHQVADLNVQREHLAVFSLLTVANGHDLAALRLLFCGLLDKKPPGGLGFFFDSLDNDTILQRSQIHVVLLLSYDDSL